MKIKRILLPLLMLSLMGCSQEDMEMANDLMIIKFNPATSEKIDVVLEGDSFHQEYSIRGSESIKAHLNIGQKYSISATALLDGDTIDYNTEFIAENATMTCNLVQVGLTFIINGEWEGETRYHFDGDVITKCTGDDCPICHGHWND